VDSKPFVDPDSEPQSRPTTGRKLWIAIMLIAGGAALGGGAVALLTRGGGGVQSGVEAKEKLLFQCPMHPTITADHPSDCPICGMKLVEVKQTSNTPLQDEMPGAGGETVPGLATVTIDPARQQLIGLRTAPAVRGPVAGSWRTVGRVQVDPTRVRKTNIKVEGYIERLYVDFIGMPVRKGDPLFSIYSPSLLAAENEYLLARQMAETLARGGATTDNGETLIAAARRKLELWDVPAAEVERLEQTRQPSKSLTFVSPIAGVVTAKNVVEGTRVSPGDAPYEITDLSMVWVMADAYESDLPKVGPGMPATFTVSAYADRPFTGQVAFIDPLLDPQTRTAKVHLHLSNREGILKPEMFGEVVFEGADREGLSIPFDAVIRAGEVDMVFLALGDGKFEPRTVQVGARNGDQVEVVSGLTEGQEVVVRANFLVDSESQLRSALAAIKGR
jgi:Cu(I)/Ag(I) efflux system membrane fusion protein